MTTVLQILLLDDQRMMRGLVKKEIENSLPPAKIYEAYCYDQAINILSKEKIDFAYVDFNLGGKKTGLDVLQYIKSNQLPTKAFILSVGSSSDGYLDQDLMLQCFAANAAGYLSKVVDGDDIFKESFDRINQGYRYFPPDCFSTSKTTEQLPKTLEDYGLSNRECEALYYICKPLSYEDVAIKMRIEEKTVRQNHAQNLFKKFNVANKIALITKVLGQGITIPKPKSDTDSN